MATTTSRQELTYDNPSDFFEAMESPENALAYMLNYNHAPSFKQLSKPSSEVGRSINLSLGNPQLNNSPPRDNFWNDSSQSGALDATSPTFGRLGSKQSCTSRNLSRKGSSDTVSLMNVPYQPRNYITMKVASTTSKPRNRSSTKSSKSTNTNSINTKDLIGKPSRGARRIIKASSADSLLNGGEGMKREQFLARNREAASKCRQKKKEWMQDLEKKARDLSARKQMLSTYLTALKNELLILKCKCLEHSDCSCEGIRDYLRSTVNVVRRKDAALYSKLGDKIFM